jgi:hypothetical protein
MEDLNRKGDFQTREEIQATSNYFLEAANDFITEFSNSDRKNKRIDKFIRWKDMRACFIAEFEEKINMR